LTRPNLQILIGPTVLILFAFAIFFSVGTAISDWRDNEFQRLAKLEGDRAALAERTESLHSDIASFADQDITDLFWTAAQSGEANALIQSAVSGTASENGILLRSVTPYTPREQIIQGSFGFRLEFEAHLNQVTEFLKDLEYDRPAIVIDRVILRRLNRPGDADLQPAVFAQVELLAPVILTGDGG